MDQWHRVEPGSPAGYKIAEWFNDHYPACDIMSVWRTSIMCEAKVSYVQRGRRYSLTISDSLYWNYKPNRDGKYV